MSMFVGDYYKSSNMVRNKLHIILLAIAIVACNEEEKLPSPSRTPQVETITATDITLNSAILNGSISDIGDAPVLECGFKLDTTEETNQRKRSDSIANNVSLLVENLLPGTTYYYRFYALNEHGIAQGQIKSFTTLTKTTPSVSAIKILKIGSTSISFKFSILSEGYDSITETGFCYSSQYKDPTLYDKKETVSLSNDTIYEIKNLIAGCSYYIWAYAINAVGPGYSKVIEIRTIESGYGDNVWLVDLNLPSGTLWASCNVGASEPEESGGHYAWGEIIESNKDYKYRVADSTYVDENGYTIKVDGHYIEIGGDISGTQYDVAHVRWGNRWVMPSNDDFIELTRNCESVKATKNNRSGYLFKSSNGNSIFLPAAGTQISGYDYTASGSTVGYYWCSDRPKVWGSDSGYEDRPNIYRFVISSSGTYYTAEERYFQNSVRPVWK